MPKYDQTRYDPPAPVAQVILRDSNSGAMLPDVLLLMDTGADITLLPRKAVERLGVKTVAGKDYQLVSFDGTKSVAQAVELDMIFQNKAYRGLYLLVDDDYGVLGRDVMANVVLLFHGPQQQWSEQVT